MGFNESNADIETKGQTASPYVRQNRTATLALTTTFQRVVFNGTSTRNANTFPLMSDGSSRLVEWDSTNNVFMFNTDSMHHYDLVFNGRITSSGLINALNLTTTTVKLQFVVPSPTPRYFPLPDDGEFVDIARTNMSTDVRFSFPYIVRAPADVRQYGIGINLCIASSGLLPGTVSLNSADISLYGR